MIKTKVPYLPMSCRGGGYVGLQGHVWSIGDSVFESTLGEGGQGEFGETNSAVGICLVQV